MRLSLFKKINKWVEEESSLFVIGFLIGLGLFSFYIFTKSVLEVYLSPINNWITLFILYPIFWITTYSMLVKIKVFNLGFYVGSALSLFILISINLYLNPLNF